MSELTKERRDELRNEVEGWELTRATVMPTLCAEIHALLDMADERDRLRGKIEEIKRVSTARFPPDRMILSIADEAPNGSQS